MVAEADTPSVVQAICTAQSRQEACKDLYKIQLDRGGKCQACKEWSRKTNLKPQQPLIGMIYTNADLRYAGNSDDKPGDSTIVTMERFGRAIAFNAELADESIWLWLALEQIEFFLRQIDG